MKLSLEEISKAVEGTLEGPQTLSATGYSIDTRTLNAGDLFFAIKGPNFDGHNFIAQAREKNAVGAVVESGSFPPGPSFGVIRVPSVQLALQALARDVRHRWGAPIIGVTGSAGKTTTKEMIATVLGRKFTVLRSVGNLNNEFGMPLCLLRAEPNQNIGVLEMGMSAKGEIRNLASIAEPNEGVITNVNPVHLEFFDSVDAIAEAKEELLQGLVEPRIAYLNNDDPRVRAMAGRFPGAVITYGIQTPSEFKVDEMQDLGLGGTGFTVRHKRQAEKFVLPLLGQHNVINALAAIAVGATHHVPWNEMKDAVAGMKPEKMRGEVVSFPAGFVVIDDSYNSNPRALTEMIRFCGKLQGYSRKIVVAGEMLELGSEGPELHRACGREAVAAGMDLIIGVRGLAKEFVAGAAGGDARFVEDAVQAGELLVRTAKKGDVILIKGSRGVKLEQAINALRAAFPAAKT